MKPKSTQRNQKLWWLVPIWFVGSVAAVLVEVNLTDELLEVSDLAWISVQGAMIATAVLILANRPGHRVGRLLLVAGVSFSLVFVVGVPLQTILNLEQDSAASTIMLAIATVWVPLVAAALTLFPTGDLPSPRWRSMSWILWVSAILGFAAPMVNGGWGGDTSEGDFSPWHDQLAPLGDVLSQMFFVSLLLSLALAAAAIITRFVRGSGEERQQMKWLALTSSIALMWMTVDFLVSGATASQGWRAVVTGLTVVLIIGSIGLAIVRFRLYDIDRIISRTVSYVLVAGLLAFIFFTIVTSVTILLPSQNSLAIATSTLAMAALFNPLRSRIQSWVDRRFNRMKYDAQNIVASYTAELQDETDLEHLTTGLAELVEEVLQPSTTTIWIRD